MFELEQAKQKLKANGWSYRSAAPKLGVTYQYLSDVLNGHYKSRRLLSKVMALPKNEPTSNQSRRKGGK